MMDRVLLFNETGALDYETVCSMCGKTLDIEDAVCDNCGASASQAIII